MVVYNLNGHLLVVRRIGMTNSPVKLGVGKKFLEKRKEPPSGKMKLVWQPQHFNVNVNIRMYNFDDVQCTVIPSVAYGFVTGMNLQLC